MHGNSIDLMQMGMVMGVVFYQFFPGTDDGFGPVSHISGSLYKVSEPDGVNPLNMQVILYPCCGAYHFVHYQYLPIETDSGLIYQENSSLYFLNFYEERETDIISNRGKSCIIRSDSAQMLVDPGVEDGIFATEEGNMAAVFPKNTRGTVLLERKTDEGEVFVLFLTDRS